MASEVLLLFSFIVIALSSIIHLCSAYESYKSSRRWAEFAERQFDKSIEMSEWLARNLKEHGDFEGHDNVIEFKRRS